VYEVGLVDDVRHGERIGRRTALERNIDVRARLVEHVFVFECCFVITCIWRIFRRLPCNDILSFYRTANRRWQKT
jgi:hypothetical protein